VSDDTEVDSIEWIFLAHTANFLMVYTGAGKYRS
jgi:hypothetical protein